MENEIVKVLISVFECIVCLFISGLAMWRIYLIERNNRLKKSEGMLLPGKKVSTALLLGTPNRYIMNVSCQINGICENRKIITTDKNIMKYKDDENIPLLYVERNNKVYWAEEKTIEDIVKTVILVGVCFFAILLGILFLFKSNTKESGVNIIADKSYLSDFAVSDGEVHIFCVISLENTCSDNMEIKLTGDFIEEADGGLLKSGTLQAHFIDKNTDTIVIEGNSSLSYVKVEFIGEYAGVSKMNSRELPFIEVIEVTGN